MWQCQKLAKLHASVAVGIDTLPVGVSQRAAANVEQTKYIAGGSIT